MRSTSDAVDPRGRPAEVGAGQTNAKAEATAGAEPTNEVDAEGREWSVRKITEFAPEDSPEPSGLHGTFYAGKTDAEIADGLRGVRLRVGADGEAWEYREVHPDVARVAAALAKDRAGVHGYSAPGPNGDPVYVEETPASLSIPAGIGARPRASAPRYAASLSDRAPTLLASSAGIETSSPRVYAPFSELTPLRAEGRLPAVDAPAGTSPNDVLGSDDRLWVKFVGPFIEMDPSANYFRHLDNTMWSFTQAHSWEY